MANLGCPWGTTRAACRGDAAHNLGVRQMSYTTICFVAHPAGSKAPSPSSAPATPQRISERSRCCHGKAFAQSRYGKGSDALIA
jgi:hypothetical protein